MNKQRVTPTQALSDELKVFLRDALPFEIWISAEYCTCEDPEEQETWQGFVVSVGEDFVITARLWQRSWLNGFMAVRMEAIDEVFPLEDEDFVCRVIRAAGDPIPPPIPITANTMTDLVDSICQHYPVVIFSLKPPSDPSDLAGVVREVSQGTIRAQLISRQGSWIPEEEEIELSNVVSLLFGSEYETRLGRLAGLPAP